MTTINTVPKGLQELLGNTSQGINPSNLLQDVRPSFDMLPFWSVDKITLFQDVAVVTTIGNSVFVRIPDGEAWAPINISSVMTGMTAADVVQTELVVFDQQFRRYTVAVGERFVNPTADAIANRYAVGFQWPRTTIYPAGFQFGAVMTMLDIAGGSESLTMSLMYVKMKA